MQAEDAPKLIAKQTYTTCYTSKHLSKPARKLLTTYLRAYRAAGDVEHAVAKAAATEHITRKKKKVLAED